MKSKMLKLKAFALSLVLVMTLFSCSDDGDDAKTFLEKNGGTVWKISITEMTMYAQINNSTTNPLELWLGEDGEDSCYIYQSLKDEGIDLEIIENTESTLKLRIDESDDDYVIITLTVTGDVLTVSSEYFEDGVSEGKEIIPLQKTDENPDALPICEFG